MRASRVEKVKPSRASPIVSGAPSAFPPFPLLNAPLPAGLVYVYAPSQAALKQATDRIQGLAGESVKEGQAYSGTVTRLLDYGAMVELVGGPGVGVGLRGRGRAHARGGQG